MAVAVMKKTGRKYRRGAVATDRTEKAVEPIRSLEDIDKMKRALREVCGYRDYIIFLFGINTALRASDIIKLKTDEVRGQDIIKVYQKKYGKPRLVNIRNIKDEITDYIDKAQPGEWFFPSRKGQHIGVTQLWRQLNAAAAVADIPYIGSHTMRKTFGYWYYKKTKDIASLQLILCHASPRETLLYIGITQDEIDDTLRDFVL